MFVGLSTVAASPADEFRLGNTILACSVSAGLTVIRGVPGINLDQCASSVFRFGAYVGARRCESHHLRSERRPDPTGETASGGDNCGDRGPRGPCCDGRLRADLGRSGHGPSSDDRRAMTGHLRSRSQPVDAQDGGGIHLADKSCAAMRPGRARLAQPRARSVLSAFSST